MNSTLARIRCAPGFRAFASIVGVRIANGNSISAYRMLIAIGSPPAIAHEIIEGWPVHRDAQRLAKAGVSLTEEAACRLAHFINRLEAHNWAEVIERAVRAAEAASGAENKSAIPGD